MTTFICPSECEALCGYVHNKIPSGLEQVAYYAGLTVEEIKLISENPNEAIVVYKQKNKADELTLRILGRSVHFDESDAARHFIWAILLSKELGINKAQLYLDAHENGQLSNLDKAMDLANNRLGLLAFESLKKENKLDDESLKNTALQMLIKKKLIVYRPQGLKK